MIVCNRKLNSKKFLPKTIKCRNYARYDVNNLLNDVSKIDWQPLYEIDNVSTALDYFTNSLRYIFDIHAPIIQKRVKGKGCPWMTTELKSLMNDRDKLLRKARKSKHDVDWNQYKRLRNLCKNKSKDQLSS